MSTVNNIPTITPAALGALPLGAPKGQLRSIGADLSTCLPLNPISPELSAAPEAAEDGVSEPESIYDLCLAGTLQAQADELALVATLSADGNLSEARMMKIQHDMQQASLKKELLRSMNDKVDEAEEAAARG